MKKYKKILLMLAFLIVNAFTLFFTIATFSVLSCIVFACVLLSSIYLLFPYLQWSLLVEWVGGIVGLFALILLIATLYHVITNINVRLNINGFNAFKSVWEYLTRF